MTGKTALWALAAVLGIVLAAGISFATSQLTSQHIGIGSEPLTAGRRLAPPPPSPVRGTTTPGPTHQPASTVPQTTVTTPAPSTQPVVPAQPAPTEAEPPAGTSPSQAPENPGDDSSHHSTGSAHQGRDD